MDNAKQCTDAPVKPNYYEKKVLEHCTFNILKV
jgi:hypothetical protein